MALVDRNETNNDNQACSCVPNLKCSKCSTLLCVHQFRTHRCSTGIARNRPLR